MRAALACVAACYLGIAAFLPSRVFWSPDEGGRYLQMIGWTLDNGLTYRLPYGGAARDPDYRFYPATPLCPRPLPGGAVRFAWPVWFSLLTAPFYRVLGCAGLYVVPLAAGVLTARLAGTLAERARPRAGTAAFLVAAMATPLLVYSQLYWEHTLQACLCLAAILCAVRARRRSAGRVLFAAACMVLLAAAVALRAETLVLAAALVAALAGTPSRDRRNDRSRRAPRALLAVLAVVALAAVLVWLTPLLNRTDAAGWTPFRNRDFGRMLSGALARLVDPSAWMYLPTHLLHVLVASPAKAENAGAWVPARSGVPLSPGWSLCAFNGLALCFLCHLLPRRARFGAWCSGAVLLGLAAAAALLSPVRYRTVHGLFLATPVLALAALPARAPSRSAEAGLLRRLAWSYLAAYVLTTLFLRPPARGLEWGPRYALPLVPLLTAIGAAAVQRFLSRAAPRERVLTVAVASFLLVLSCGFTLRGLNEVRLTKRELRRLDERIRTARRPVVVENRWLPCLLAVSFAEHEVYVVEDNQARPAWMTPEAGIHVR